MPNLFTVVDENDNITGYKAKEDIDPEKEFYRVSALRLTNSQGDILIAQRSFSKSHSPCKRGPAVAGTVEEGETYEENIIKEMEEEIGLINNEITMGPKVKRKGTPKHFVQRFFATVNKDINQFTIQKEEVEAIKRISKDKLRENIKEHPENYVIKLEKNIEEFDWTKN